MAKILIILLLSQLTTSKYSPQDIKDKYNNYKDSKNENKTNEISVGTSAGSISSYDFEELIKQEQCMYVEKNELIKHDISTESAFKSLGDCTANLFQEAPKDRAEFVFERLTKCQKDLGEPAKNLGSVWQDQLLRISKINYKINAYRLRDREVQTCPLKGDYPKTTLSRKKI